MSVAVAVDGVGKKFRKGARGWAGRGSLRDVIASIVSRGADVAREEFWALSDVSFHLPHGEALGIIGPNGAGKSTMLKILAGILRPDTGTVAIDGRLSALIEVGAGFHPELTGRENIFLNGSILGLKRKEIHRRLDAIIDFAELGEFIDTPVKRYSSGMFVRLGFAVAVHVDPDILLVDEVLSVGDIGFQQKCMTRIGALREQGTTMILVSHNLHTVATVCTHAVALFQGHIEARGAPDSVIAQYKERMAQPSVTDRGGRAGGETASGISIRRVDLTDHAGRTVTRVQAGEPLCLRLHYSASERIRNPVFGFGLAVEGLALWGTSTKLDGVSIPEAYGDGTVTLRLHTDTLLPNTYLVTAGIWGRDGTASLAADMNAATFYVASGHTDLGVMHIAHEWAPAP